MDTPELAHAKVTLRRQQKEGRKSLSPESWASQSFKLLGQLVGLPAYVESEVLVAFAGVKGEPDTRPLCEATLELGRRIYLPRVEADGHLSMRRVTNLDSLVMGNFEVPEPKAKSPEGLISESQAALVLVPGLAFDTKGNRLGYGKGYYDRFLAGLEGHAGPRITVGIGLCDAWVDEVPIGDYDVALNWIVTPDRVHRVEPAPSQG